MNIAEEALELHLLGLEQDGEPIPNQSEPPYECEMGSIITPIAICPHLIKRKYRKQGCKKKLCYPIPTKSTCRGKKINFSNVLQNALKEMLKVNNYNL
ncbi:MAG: hypothetical protein LBD73_02500 [Deferribacteraceae bacterium]|jgi:hypothetical protein|nr:hypothetical protein [Deferribacteraceae bacterium]